MLFVTPGPYRLDLRLIEQDTAAVPPEGGEADDPQIRVDLRAVICNLQRLAIERRALIDPQPFGVHIGEDAAEGVVNELLQRRFFQPCQCLVAVAEDPVHGGAGGGQRMGRQYRHCFCRRQLFSCKKDTFII